MENDREIIMMKAILHPHPVRKIELIFDPEDLERLGRLNGVGSLC